MTVTTQQAPKDVIAPPRYLVTYEWVIDSATNVPVGVRVIETHT